MRVQMVTIILLASLPAATNARVHSSAAGGTIWSLTKKRDKFLDQISCRLRSGDGMMLFQPHAIGFHFRHIRDTLPAWYRIDGKTALRWQNRYTVLIAAGAQVDGNALDNPTDSIVWLPLEDVVDAGSVVIRPNAQSRPRTFHLGDIKDKIAEAGRIGCHFNAGAI